MEQLDYFIGDPGAQMDDWIFQGQPDNCVVAAEASIINQFLDEPIAIEEHNYISMSNGWWEPGMGTSPEEVGNLMDCAGVANHTVVGASVEQLLGELHQGNGVIVGVNSDELWDEGILDKIQDFFSEAFGIQDAVPADHAVVVTGVDMSDPNNPQVILNDSGSPNGAAVRYPIDQFVDAWENSGFQYTATDDPIPNGEHASPASMGVDFGDFLGTVATIATADPMIGLLVNQGVDFLSEQDWEAMIASI